MPNPLHSVQTSDNYSDACSILDVFRSNGGSFDIDGASVFYQLQYGGQGDTHYTEEVEAKPGAGLILPDTTGIRFRSRVAGMPATISAVIAPHAQPYAAISSSSSAATAPAGVITGIVDVGGNILGGTGFGVVRNSAGRYTVTFTTAFAAPAVVNVTILSTGNYVAPFMLGLPTAASFTPSFNLSNGVATDAEFNFTAQAVV